VLEFSIHGVVAVRVSEAPALHISEGREAEVSFPTRRREELLGGVLDHDPLRGRCPAAC
jgi:hypothetical protein